MSPVWSSADLYFVLVFSHTSMLKETLLDKEKEIKTDIINLEALPSLSEVRLDKQAQAISWRSIIIYLFLRVVCMLCHYCLAIRYIRLCSVVPLLAPVRWIKYLPSRTMWLALQRMCRCSRHLSYKSSVFRSNSDLSHDQFRAHFRARSASGKRARLPLRSEAEMKKIGITNSQLIDAPFHFEHMSRIKKKYMDAESSDGCGRWNTWSCWSSKIFNSLWFCLHTPSPKQIERQSPSIHCDGWNALQPAEVAGKTIIPHPNGRWFNSCHFYLSCWSKWCSNEPLDLPPNSTRTTRCKRVRLCGRMAVKNCQKCLFFPGLIAGKRAKSSFKRAKSSFETTFR